MQIRLLLPALLLLLPGPRASSQDGNSPASDFVKQIFTADSNTFMPQSNSGSPFHPPLAHTSDQTGASFSPRNLPAGTADSSTAAEPAVVHPPCAEPAQLFSASEYNGPLKRLAAWFSRRPEIATVPARKNGKRICGLYAEQKFQLFVRTTIDPVTFAGAAVSAGVSQWQNEDREFGQGAEGFGKRYGAAFADRATWNFFGKFFYPAIFQQDPRYFREGRGTIKSRLGHALAHSFVARSDSGKPMPNLSLWAATSSTVAVVNLYHPGNDRGFGPAAQRFGIAIGASMGIDVLREFWPEVVRKFRLPFHERRIVPPGSPATP
ncbi:MAG: hypothetical protein ACM3SW_01670 [Actinomycetota bacterium]